MYETIPEDFANNLWLFGGHSHNFGEYCYTSGAGTLVQLICGAALPVSTFGDHTNPAITAVACRGGRIVARYACDCKDGYWHLWNGGDRSSPNTITGYYDPLDDSYTRLASYNGGTHDLTDYTQTAETGGGFFYYRYTGTWLSYMYNCHVAFPMPVGATKFWACLSIVPSTSVEMSDDGVSWTAITPLPSLSSNFLIMDIPVGLLAATTLHCRIKSAAELHGSGFGFLE